MFVEYSVIVSETTISGSSSSIKFQKGIESVRATIPKMKTSRAFYLIAVSYFMNSYGYGVLPTGKKGGP